MNLPKWYKKWVTRVSNIVSFIYPFWWEWEKRYLDWLADNVPLDRKRWFSIDKDEYMKEACDIWTYVHWTMEDYMLKKKIKKCNIYKEHKSTIEYWFKYIDELNNKFSDIWWLPEQTVIDNKDRFQWTLDLARVNEKTKEVWLYDYKTWWIAKKRYWLPNPNTKPYDKLKKMSLQLSLYAETFRQKWYIVRGIYWVWLHEGWTYEYKLTLMETKEIDKILNDFMNNNFINNNFINKVKLPLDFILIIKNNPMIIEVQTTIPNNPYSKATIVIEEWDMEWKTPEEKIEEAIRLQKNLLTKY